MPDYPYRPYGFEDVPAGAVLVTEDGYQHLPGRHYQNVYRALCGERGIVGTELVRRGPVDLPVCPECEART